MVENKFGQVHKVKMILAIKSIIPFPKELLSGKNTKFYKNFGFYIWSNWTPQENPSARTSVRPGVHPRQIFICLLFVPE